MSFRRRSWHSQLIRVVILHGPGVSTTQQSVTAWMHAPATEARDRPSSPSPAPYGQSDRLLCCAIGSATQVSDSPNASTIKDATNG